MDTYIPPEKQLQGRLVTDIIIIILEKIPNTERELLRRLQNYYHSLWNKAPESLKSRDGWDPFVNILNSFIPVMHTDWHMEIYNIVKGDS